ncbi:helix-turn-helix domain-containing protein [Vibrio kasasachensis]|uniref:helix-turn-helix domain-containing protein n=1 Tax=Vibrio kasasachensis TaxID=2910248 RepID=UPI003D14FA9C
MPEKSRNAGFASRIMLDILSAGLSKLSLHELSLTYSHDKAHIPLETKREFVSFVSGHYGLPTLLKTGVGICDFVDTPTGKALLSRSTPHSLLSKWQRLESYIHSNHYIECEVAPTFARISHQSRGDSSPTIEEDLAVLGVICGLIHHITDSAITLTLDESGQQPIFSYPDLTVCGSIERSSEWYIHWSADFSPSKTQPLQDTSKGDYLSADNIIDKTKRAIYSVGLLEANMLNTAKLMALSTRSMQRYLNSSSAKFASILQEVRVHHASHLLLSEDLSFAEIGFICGFSDQAHFNRIFKKWTGMSPKQYCLFKSD